MHSPANRRRHVITTCHVTLMCMSLNLALRFELSTKFHIKIGRAAWEESWFEHAPTAGVPRRPRSAIKLQDHARTPGSALVLAFHAAGRVAGTQSARVWFELIKDPVWAHGWFLALPLVTLPYITDWPIRRSVAYATTKGSVSVRRRGKDARTPQTYQERIGHGRFHSIRVGTKSEH